MQGDERPVRVSDLRARLGAPSKVILFAAHLAGVEPATVGGTAFFTPAQVGKVLEFFEEKDPQCRFHTRQTPSQGHAAGATRGRARR